MSETVAQAITGIKDTLKQERLDFDSLNEKETIQYVVDPLLRASGWNLSKPSEVKPEFTVDRYRVDYALNLDGQGGASVFIEIKKPSVNLQNHHTQLLNYCAQQNVNLGILTNGKIWWFFLPTYPGLPWMEKRFAQVDLSSGNGAPKTMQKVFEDFLNKAKVTNGESAALGRGRIDEILKKAEAKKNMVETWNRIIASPDDDLVKLLIKKTADYDKPAPTMSWAKEFFREQGSRIRASANPPPISDPLPNKFRGQGVVWIFDNQERSSKNWKSALVEFCELMHDRHTEDFDKVLSKVRGSMHLYFSRTESDLISPKPIGDSGYHVATNHSAKQIISIGRRVARAFEEESSFDARKE